MIESSYISDSCLKIVISYTATTTGGFWCNCMKGGFPREVQFFFGACLKIRRKVKHDWMFS